MKTSFSNIHQTKKKEAFRALQGNVVEQALRETSFDWALTHKRVNKSNE